MNEKTNIHINSKKTNLRNGIVRMRMVRGRLISMILIQRRKGKKGFRHIIRSGGQIRSESWQRSIKVSRQTFCICP